MTALAIVLLGVAIGAAAYWLPFGIDKLRRMRQ